jgi:tRNA nucleotidyltransferase/poly(A) polymerase
VALKKLLKGLMGDAIPRLAPPARIFAVGGAVRDHLLSQGPKGRRWPTSDIDLVVFGMGLEDARRFFKKHGLVKSVARKVVLEGEPRGGLLIFRRGGMTADITVPTDPDGRPVQCSAQALREDALKRDFTVNAIYLDPLDGSIKDPLDGLKDVQAMRLMPAGPGSFVDDPLRLLRAMSLISRRGLYPGGELLRLARESAGLLSRVSKDRIWPEWRGWSESCFPHLGLRFLEESSLIRHFPELSSLTGSLQSWHFHPEGNVWDHTVLVVQAMAELDLPEIEGHTFNRTILLLTALTHDLGKNASARKTDERSGKIFYPNHAGTGVPFVRSFLGSIKCPGWILRPVLKLSRRHMEGSFSTLSAGDLRRIARELYPEANLADLWAVKAADWNGRLYWPESYPVDLEEFLEPVGGSLEAPADIVRGSELMGRFSLKAGPELGLLVAEIRRLWDDGRIADREGAFAAAERILKRISS